MSRLASQVPLPQARARGLWHINDGPDHRPYAISHMREARCGTAVSRDEAGPRLWRGGQVLGDAAYMQGLPALAVSSLSKMNRTPGGSVSRNSARRCSTPGSVRRIENEEGHSL